MILRLKGEDSTDPVLIVNSEFGIQIESQSLSADTDSKFVEIALKSTQPNTLKIGTIGAYKFRENFLKLTTQGYLIVVSSRDQDTPTRVFYFGDYNPFRSGDDEQNASEV